MANLKAGNPKTLADWTESAPDGAEAEAVRLCAFTAEKTGTPVYIVHLTSAAGLKAVREAKAAGVPLFCESTSTYLYYDNADPAGMKVKRHPAIRSAADRDALWGGVAEGTIETFGTDNVTATAEENNYVGSFWENRGAFPSLATHVTQILHRGHHEQGLPLWLLADRMCRRPAELFGLYPRKGTLQVGADADLTVIDPDLKKTVRGVETASRSDFTPLEGRRLKGWPVTVVKGGEVVVEEGKLLCDPGVGRVLTPVSES
jgi:dihydroorotase-like cyclic amidohydrolase